jgi:outer membrane protein W
VNARIVLLTGGLMTIAAGAGAQPLANGDVTTELAWLNVRAVKDSSYNEWYHRSAYGSVAAGWYWTNHLKSEIEVGASTAAELYAATTVQIDGRTHYISSRYRFTTKRIVATQHYQFYENAWVHPYVGIGIDGTWESRDQHDNPLYVYDSVTHTTHVERPAQDRPRSRRFDVRPVADAGAKFYVNRRAFFRTDMRMVIDGGIDEVLFRFGFGVDF